MIRRRRSGDEYAGSFYSEVRRARLWLPATIIGVVLVWQLVVVPLGDATWQFWSTLLFYGILGPAVTFIVLDWIAGEVRLREEAQARLSSLYTELRDSHELLAGIQRVTEAFAAAPDLEATISAAGRGLCQVTGARGAAVVLEYSGTRLSETYGLDETQAEEARRWALNVSGDQQLDYLDLGDSRHYVLLEPVIWGGRLTGSVQAWFALPPDARQREAFSILAAEFAAAAEAAGARMRDIYMLADVDRSFRAEGNLSRLLQTLLLQMTQRTGATTGGVYLLDDAGLLHLGGSVPEARPFSAVPIRPGNGLIGAVAMAGETLLIQDTSSRSGDRLDSPLLTGAGSVLLLPMRREENVLGVVVLAHEERHAFNASAVPLLEVLTGQVSWAVRNASAYMYSEELAIAEERARIAREIHDGIAQSLAFTALKLDLIARLLHRDPAKATEELELVARTVRELIREVRRSIFALRPVDLERLGFVETLRRYASDYGQQNEIFVTVDVEEVTGLSLKAETALFRIFQESMNNIAKHAQARNVRVEAGHGSGQIAYVQVSDDGNGFDLQAADTRAGLVGGLGLRQMRERMDAVGGRFMITSHPGEGTTVRAEVPL